MKRLEETNYHRILRVGAAVMACVLLFESGLIVQSTAQLAQNTHQYVGQVVGASASVRPNEINVITAELTQQRQLLDAREAALNEREIAVELNTGGSNEQNTFIVAAILLVLLILIVTNYVLDFMRGRAPAYSERRPETV